MILNKGECDSNQSKDDPFVKRVAKNNSWDNGVRHKIHEISLINCFVFVTVLVWQTVHSSAMTQVTANLMEKTLQQLFQGNGPCCSWFNKERLWPLRSFENFFSQITTSGWNRFGIHMQLRMAGIIHVLLIELYWKSIAVKAGVKSECCFQIDFFLQCCETRCKKIPSCSTSLKLG